MKLPVVLICIVATASVYGQIPPNGIAGSIASSTGFFDSFDEVTSKRSESLEALKQCEEDTSEGRHICVPYNLCDAATGRIDQSGKVDGFGVIDIRFGASKCPHTLEKCCLVPPDEVLTPRPPNSPNTTPTTVDASKGSFCGIRNSNGIDFKITGNNDNEAEYGEFPWMIAVLRKDYNPAENKTLALCGGSLITPLVVLTGAHCIQSFAAGEIKIRAGEWDTQTNYERLPYQERDISEIIIHQEFNPKNLINDVALLVLKDSVSKADNVGTICLPPQGQKFDSQHCFASGWGKNRFGKAELYQVILKKIELPIVPHYDCEKSLRTTRLGAYFKLHDSFTCAGGEDGRDTCTGDGGGPLVCPDPNNPGRYQQAGIVAWGIGCGENQIPGVYVDVAQFREWVDLQMDRLNLNSEPYTK